MNETAVARNGKTLTSRPGNHNNNNSNNNNNLVPLYDIKCESMVQTGSGTIMTSCELIVINGAAITDGQNGNSDYNNFRISDPVTIGNVSNVFYPYANVTNNNH